MQSAGIYELDTTGIADPRGQRDAPVPTDADLPANAPQPGSARLTIGQRRKDWQRRFGRQLWVLLHAQALLDCSDTYPYQR